MTYTCAACSVPSDSVDKAASDGRSDPSSIERMTEVALESHAAQGDNGFALPVPAENLSAPGYAMAADSPEALLSVEERAGAVLGQIAQERTRQAREQAAWARRMSQSASARSEMLVDELAQAQAEIERLKAEAASASEDAQMLAEKAGAAKRAAKEVEKNPFAPRQGEGAPSDKSADMTGDVFEDLPKSDGLAAFSLASKHVPALDDSRRAPIEKAVRDIEDAGYETGFVFADLESGAGICRNADEAFYTASAFKAAMVFYLLERSDGREVEGADRYQAEAAIMQSSNGDYDSLAARQMGGEYEAWLDRYGIAFDGTYYAYSSARSLARIWADLFQYLRSDEGDAAWFSGLLENTNRSFIRDGLAETDAVVRNKAGWIADGYYSATTDCAYIDEEGHPYLMVVLSDQPDSDAASSRCAALSKALFSARDALR